MPFSSREEIQQARRLRSGLTDAEQRLWFRLRGKQMEGLRFRRQVPVGPYVADFLCVSARLIVEVDGGQHTKTVSEDQRRTQHLEGHGYRVLRFWDNDVLQHTDEVLESIRLTIKRAPTLPYP